MASTRLPLTFPLIFDDAYEDTLERLKNRLTTPYYTEPDGDIDKLLRVQAEQFENELHTTDSIVLAHKLAEATGYSLDQWGVLTRVLRKTGESDDNYRARQYTQIAIYMRSATPQDMVSTCAGVLGVATDRVAFADGALSASFDMTVFISDIYASGLVADKGTFECKDIAGAHDPTKGYNNIANANPGGGTYSGRVSLPLVALAEMMKNAKAEGVEMSMFAKGTFECNNIGGFHDPTKGYNDVANTNPDGGRYSGIPIII